MQIVHSFAQLWLVGTRVFLRNENLDRQGAVAPGNEIWGLRCDEGVACGRGVRPTLFSEEANFAGAVRARAKKRKNELLRRVNRFGISAHAHETPGGTLVAA